MFFRYVLAAVLTFRQLYMSFQPDGFLPGLQVASAGHLLEDGG